MFKNYLKTALRNFSRNKSISAINIFGLSAGVTCCLLIALYVFHETSYDRFHKKGDHIFRVTMEYAFDGVVNKIAVTGNKVATAFKADFPEVENSARFLPVSAIVKNGEKIFDEKNFVYADPSIFDIFSFSLEKGDPHSALNDPNKIVLTRSSARKYFGESNPIGKTLRINDSKEFLVTGIIADCPDNSQIKFDFLASFSSLVGDRYDEESWWDASYFTYFLLKNPTQAKSLEANIPAYMRSLNKDNGLSNSNYLIYHLEPLQRVHLYSTVEGGFEPAGDYRYVYIFSAIAILILTIACFNYLNLITAKATERAKEVGLRKVLGAIRKQVIIQFMAESLIVVVLSVLVGLIFLFFLLPYFNHIIDKHLLFSDLLKPLPLALLAMLILLIGILGGGYPALVLSGFSPIKVLKGNFSTGNSGTWLRKSLIVTQFIISVALIACTLIINSQLRYIQNKKIGYNKDQIVILPMDSKILKNIRTFKNEFFSNRNILSVSSCSQGPIFIPGKYNLTLDQRDMIVTAVRVDKDFVKTLEINILTGQDFNEAEQLAVDEGRDTVLSPIIINEAAAKFIGWNPDVAIGKHILFQGRKSFVKGVVKDFHFSSMHENIGPLVIFINGSPRNMLVRLSGNQIPATLDYMKSKWNLLAPHRPFEYQFLDDQYNELYSAETRTGNIFRSFALLAILLACLGLFGLAAYSAQQRTREIGIRKVLGASVGGIITLLSKDFLRLILISMLIAFPIAWWSMNEWLSDFAYRIHISWWVFAIAGTASLIISIATIGSLAIKAALSNPIKSLRSE